MTDRALVCVFTHPDGRFRPICVTRDLSDDGWYVALYKQDGEAEVYVFGTAEACDHHFMSVARSWAMGGFAFHRSIEISVPPFGVNEKPREWADLVLDSVVIPVKKQSA